MKKGNIVSHHHTHTFGIDWEGDRYVVVIEIENGLEKNGHILRESNDEPVEKLPAEMIKWVNAETKKYIMGFSQDLRGTNQN